MSVATASRKEVEESLSSRSGDFSWLLPMSSEISRRCRRGKIFDGLQAPGGGYGESAAPGALFGPGSGERLGWEGRIEARSDGDWGFEGGAEKPAKERDNLWTGGGTNTEFAGFSGSPGGEEASVRDIGWKRDDNKEKRGPAEIEIQQPLRGNACQRGRGRSSS